MDELKNLLSSLELDIQDLEESFARIEQTAASGGATVEEWARITGLGLVFNRLKGHRLILIREIAGLAQVMEAAGLISQT